MVFNMNKQGKAIGDNQRNSMKMACEILFIFAEVSFCAFADSPPDVIEGGGAAKHSLAESVTGEHYLSRDGAQLDVSEGSLIIARDLYPEIDIPKYLYLIDEMVQELETRIHGNDDPHNLIQMINEYLFEEQGFQYEAGTHFLNKVLDDKRGSCVGLATLYIALTQRLDIPCCAVNIPQHVIVRFSDGNTRINLEMQHGGKILPDAWYIENWGIGADAIQTRAYL